MKTAAEINDGLAQCYGTEAYHRVSALHGRLVITDGVLWLAEASECFWLIDIIASYQPLCMKDAMLRDIQFWTLTVADDKTAKIICERASGDVVIAQKIPFTDFPLSEIKIFVQAGECGGRPVMVALLPSEN